MRIKGIILENFRGYKARTHVTLEQFTALIGRRNAAGAKNENNVAVAHTPMVSDEDLKAAKKVTYSRR